MHDFDTVIVAHRVSSFFNRVFNCLKVIEYDLWTDPGFLFFFLLSSLMGFILNYSWMLCTRFNSPLTTTVTGCLKVLADLSTSLHFKLYTFNFYLEYPHYLFGYACRRGLYIHKFKLSRTHYQVFQTFESIKQVRLYSTWFLISSSISSIFYSYLTFTERPGSTNTSSKVATISLSKTNSESRLIQV